jgi:FkbM family methyltransferase
MLKKLRSIAGGLRRKLFPPPAGRSFQYLDKIRGIIHVGANSGQERRKYDEVGLNVLWIEPIPKIFDRLNRNIASYPRQRALNALVSDRDDQRVEFHIADNEGESSSILKMDEHRDMWPEVHQNVTVNMNTVTLPTLIQRESIDLHKYDALLLDTQGAELMILRGAVSLLNRFHYIETEAANFSAYAGCPTRDELVAFLKDHGFELVDEIKFGKHRLDASKSYFQLLFQRQRSA